MNNSKYLNLWLKLIFRKCYLCAKVCGCTTWQTSVNTQLKIGFEYSAFSVHLFDFETEKEGKQNRNMVDKGQMQCCMLFLFKLCKIVAETKTMGDEAYRDGLVGSSVILAFHHEWLAKFMENEFDCKFFGTVMPLDQH